MALRRTRGDAARSAAHYDEPVSAHSRRGEIALLAVGLALSLVAGEALVRLRGAGGGPGGYAPVRTDRKDRGPVNSQGYRDLERAVPRPPGVRRVVCIGDSFTWGVGVLFDDTWPQRLERGLSRARGETWEAVNLAERGLNAVQEMQRLEAEGFAYGPDVVVVGYVLNDSEDENAAERRRAEDWVAESRRKAGPVESLLGRSALYRFVRTRLRATAQNRERVLNFRAMYEDDDPGWRATREALRTMGGLCRARGVPLVVAIFPLFGNPLDDTYPFADIHERVARAAAEGGAKVVDLLPLYRGLRSDLLVVDGPRDEHPNEIALRIAGQALVRAVDQVVPLPRAPRP
jgi:GDSL-like Lipase/Acylhydrolase family